MPNTEQSFKLEIPLLIANCFSINFSVAPQIGSPTIDFCAKDPDVLKKRKREKKTRNIHLHHPTF